MWFGALGFKCLPGFRVSGLQGSEPGWVLGFSGSGSRSPNTRCFWDPGVLGFSLGQEVAPGRSATFERGLHGHSARAFRML